MEKLEKLKELNETIKNICINLETKIFIEDIDNIDEKIIKEYEPEDVETK